MSDIDPLRTRQDPEPSARGRSSRARVHDPTPEAKTRRRRALPITLAVLLPTLAVPGSALAYGGPGSVVTGIGALLAAVAAILAALFGFFWFPIKRLVRRLRGQDEEGAAEAS